MNILQLEFVQNALLAGTLVAAVAAIIGYFVVIRAQAFAGHALAHIGFAGATGAAVMGINPLLGTFVFTLLAAFGIGSLGERVRGRDIEVGMVLSFALGLGVLFLTMYTQFATETVSILFGSLLSVSRGNVVIMLASGIAVCLITAAIFRPLLFASIDPEVAEARGVPVRFLSLAFIILLAVTVAEAVQVVGVLLVFALLVAPPATAIRLVQRPARALALSIALGLVYTWLGLLLAFVGHWPVSFYIAALSAVTFLTVEIGSRVLKPGRYKERQHPNRECVPARR